MKKPIENCLMEILNDAVCDATGDDSSTAAEATKIPETIIPPTFAAN